MAYGIDDTIQQKVDAYRGNPGALQRRYTQNRELIDLLALQKLKSEKDAAARDMQMKMQQQPQTIAQQYEAELAGRTKDEMLQGVAGVMQQRQAQQQRNMQRVANMPTKMAQGGIIGFATGGSPQDIFEEIKKIREKIAKGEITQKEGEAQIEAIAPEQKDPSGRRGIFSGFLGSGKRSKIRPTTGGPTKATAENALDQVILDATTQGMTGTTEGSILGGGGTSSQRAPEQPQKVDSTLQQNMIPPAAPDEAPPPAESESDPLMDEIGKIGGRAPLTDTTITVPESNLAALDAEKYAPDMTQADEYRAGLADVYRDFMESDPESMAQERRDDAMDFLKLSPEDQAIRKRVIDERKAQEDEIAGIERLRYGDPTELRRQRLIQNLIGASGTTIGSTLASGAGASIRERDRQRAGIDALRGERFGVQDKRLVQEGADVTERQNIKSKAFEAGESGYEQGYNQVRAGVAGIANLGDQAQSFAEKQADRLLAVDEANLTRDTANRKMELQANIKTAEIASSNQLARFRASLVRDTKIIEALMAREKNAIDAERNDVMRTGNTIKMQGVLGRVNQIIATVRQQYITAYAPLIQQAQALGDDADPDVASLEKAREMAIDQSTKELQGMIEDLERNVAGGLPGQTPAGSTDGFTVTPVS
jgi:hypothetical protein